MNKKKLIAILTLMCFMFTLVPVAAMAESGSIESTTPDFKYDYDSDNDGVLDSWDISYDGNSSVYAYLKAEGENYTIYVMGKGITSQYGQQDTSRPWYSDEFKTKITKIVIGSDITTINKFIFDDMSAVTDLVIDPYGKLEVIGEGAFYRTVSLSSEIIVPETVTMIDGSAFATSKFTSFNFAKNGENLKSIGGYAFPGTLKKFNSKIDGMINIPENVISVDTGAFQNNANITSVYIPAAIKNMIATFCSCSNLKIVEFAENSNLKNLNSTAWGAGVFQGCPIESVVLPAGLEKIAIQSFYSNEMSYVVIPKTVTTIEDLAFANGTKLHSVALNGDVTTIGGKNAGSTFNGSLVYAPTLETAQKAKSEMTVDAAMAVTNGGEFALDQVFERMILATPMKDGYVFAGWYTDEACTAEAPKKADDTTKYQASSKGIYYAKWVASGYDANQDEQSNISFEITYGDTSEASKELKLISTGNNTTTPSAIAFQSKYLDYSSDEADTTKVTVKPKADLNVGTYKERVILITNDNATHFVTVTLTVNPKNIEITGLEAKDRVYNGTDTVELTGGELSGIINGDDVQAIVPTTGTAASANAGTHAVIFADITLNGTDAGNYTLVNPSVTVEIGKAEQAIGYTITSIEKTTDDGAFINELTEYIVDDTIVYSSSEESVATVDADGTVTIKGAGTTTITATAEETTNYNAKTAYYTLTVLPTMQRVDPVGTIGYIVEHYKDGVLAERECLTGETDEVVTAVPKIYDGYTYNADKSIVSGTLQPITTEDDIVILKLYYDKTVEPENDTPVYTGGSSGFSGSYNYPVSTPEVDNGDVKLSDSNAVEGESLTATVTPDNGYGVADVIVTDEDGNIIPVEFIGNGQYTFVMPDGEVSVEVVCKPAITMKIGDTMLNIFGKTVKNDVAPTIGEGNRTMLPIRAVANALGADVDWDPATQKVTIVKDGKVIEVFIGKDYAFVDGERIQLDVKAYIENDRTYLQVRFVTEALDAEVIWDPVKRMVTIIPE